MQHSDQKYIKRCKKQIEKKFSFGNGESYSQRDLILLSKRIEEKTGVCISLSTLKRFWKNDFKQSPQLATLNALVMVLDYKDWQEFKLKNQKTSVTLSKNIWVILGIALIGAVLVFILPFEYQEKIGGTKKLEINEPVHFSTRQTVTSGIPNTVIFKYNVSAIKADSFYIQQSWNPNHRMAIVPGENVFSSIYYEPGYHRARLFANDSMIAMQPIHILSDGWEPHIYYSGKDLIPIHFRNDKFIGNGQLQLSKELLRKRGVDLSRFFMTRIANSQEFNVSSDNFNLVSRIKVDSVLESPGMCPWMQIIVVTEKHIFFVLLENKGCEHYARYKLGEINKSGKSHDLSALGCNIYQWQNIGITVQNKHAVITINGEVAFQEVFNDDFGNIVGLIYLFEGTGAISHARLDGEDGQVEFEDNFE